MSSVASTLKSFRAGQTLQSFAGMGRPQADPRPHDHDELGAHVSRPVECTSRWHADDDVSADRANLALLRSLRSG